MLNNLKLLLGITDTTKDNLLTLIINQCVSDAEFITHLSDVSNLDSVIVQMAIYRYNRLGTEGVNSEGYNSANYTYAPDYPDYIVRQLIANRRIRTVQ